MEYKSSLDDTTKKSLRAFASHSLVSTFEHTFYFDDLNKVLKKCGYEPKFCFHSSIFWRKSKKTGRTVFSPIFEVSFYAAVVSISSTLLISGYKDPVQFIHILKNLDYLAESSLHASWAALIYKLSYLPEDEKKRLSKKINSLGSFIAKIIMTSKNLHNELSVAEDLEFVKIPYKNADQMVEDTIERLVEFHKFKKEEILLLKDNDLKQKYVFKELSREFFEIFPKEDYVKLIEDESNWDF